MDAETSRRISELASSLKKMHLATTMEEAVERAKEIIISTKTKEQDKPLEQLVGISKEERNTVNEAVNAVKHVIDADDTLNKVKDELSKLKSTFQNVKEAVADANTASLTDTKVHAEEKKQTDILKKKIIQQQQAVVDAEEFVKMADDIQEKQ
ncbi:MAG: hypothetical protein HY363_02925 [Candidatus Aenigmarchaeota archaeon]|nr:hypothetical protein [Candidatus Aenigmarchaeota archaeon]